MDEGILSTIGNTPLVKLSRIFMGSQFELFGKVEGLNPGGSAKDRSALNILKAAMAEGKIGPDTVIIESSSGNLGIGLAQVCCYYGLRFICVVDAKTTLQNIRIIKAYGAEIDLVSEPDPVTGEFVNIRSKQKLWRWTP
jgi:N-(2-amino-2-carboxyethyl)-L-glutamate synthase